MKRGLISLTIFAFIFSGCNFSIPKKVSVFSKASYNFTVAEVEKDLGSLFDLTDTGDNFSFSEGTFIYDYNPENNSDDLQQFLVNMPIQQIPVDFASYFDSTNLAESISDMSFENDIVTPNVGNMDLQQSATTAEIMDAINAMASFSGTSSGIIEFETDFSEIIYKTGVMLVYQTGDAASVKLSYNEEVVSEASFYGSEARLELGGKTIYHDGMRLDFVGGGVTYYTGVIEQGGVIDKCKQITVNNVSIPATLTLDTSSDPSTFESCTIGEGSLYLELKTPSIWEGAFTKIYDMNLFGGINVFSYEFEKDGEGVKCSLENKEITHDETTVSCTITFGASTADIDFSEAPSLEGKCEVKKVKEMVVSLDDVNTSVENTTNLSEEFIQNISKIVFDPSGLKGTYINELPAGNDIKFTADSSFLGMAGMGKTLEGGKEEDTSFEMLGVQKTNVIASTPAASGEYNSIDFTMKMVLPGATDEEPSKIRVNDVEPGKTYKIMVSMKADINWTSMFLKVSSDAKRIKSFLSTGVDLSSIFNSMSDALGETGFLNNIKINSLPIYLYCQKPELESLSDLAFDGTIKITLADTESTAIPGVTPTYMLGSAAASEKMAFINVPDLGIRQDEGKVPTVLTDISKHQFGAKADFMELINTNEDKVGSLAFDVDLALTSKNGIDIEIKRSEFEEMSSENSVTNIEVVALIILPMKFDVERPKGSEENTKIDLLALIGAMPDDSDLFGRTEPTNIDDIMKYVEIIDKVVLSYKSSKVPFVYNKGDGLTILVNMNTPSAKEQKLTMQKGSIIFDPDIVREMMGICPFRPTVEIIMPEGTFSIPRELGFKAKIELELDTDGTLDLFGGDK